MTSDDPTPPLSPDATVALKGGIKVEDPLATVRIEGAKTPTLKLSGDQDSSPRRLTWVPWVLGLAIVGGTVGGVLWYMGRSQAATAANSPSTPVAPGVKLPPEVEAKVREANQGDVHAMHALAIWYFNGIYVPKDREQGLAWYRKAAAHGSDAARQELADIEGGKQ